MASMAIYENENMLGEEEVGGEAIKCKDLAMMIAELDVSSA